MLASLLSALHVLALGIGLGAVVVRGRALRAVAGGDAGAVPRVLRSDTLWGIAALLWVSTGSMRAFGRLEKSPDFYLDNGLFWVKMALFVGILVLEIVPIVTLVRWRVALRKGQAIDPRQAARLIGLNDAETVLVLVIPFVAAAMARGVWLLA